MRSGEIPSLIKIERYLEKNGWKRAVAGDTDFNAALLAVEEMLRSGRGLIVSGEYGVGKTALTALIVKALGPVFKVNLALPAQLERLTPEWQVYWANDPCAQNVWLDDLGAEPLTNEYGVKLERAGDFIVDWHERAAPGVRLVITTNLRTDEVDARYGGRVLSRLKDLCVPLRLVGQDKRSWARPTGGQ